MNHNYRPRKWLVITTVATAMITLLLIASSCFASRQHDIIFSVIGDVPRSEAEVGVLDEQIFNHNKISPAQFIVHVGDIKDGKSPCNEAVYESVATQLKEFAAPLFIIPGDNEWNDCIDPDPAAAWGYWTKHFMGFEENWQFNPIVCKQEQQPENFAFLVDGVTFIGLNLVGGRIHDKKEWDEKINMDIEWVAEQLSFASLKGAVIFAQANPDTNHIVFINGLRSTAREFGRPILFVHGDGHHWIHDDPWLEPNLVRVQVDKGGIADPLLVKIKQGNPIKFEFEREPFKGIQ
ncbi:hypothetical protein ACFL6E_05710 [Candidatus Neomarinimicrobiota bacterium]